MNAFFASDVPLKATFAPRSAAGIAGASTGFATFAADTFPLSARTLPEGLRGFTVSVECIKGGSRIYTSGKFSSKV